MRRYACRNLALNLLTAAISLLVTMAVLEFLIFRFVLIAPDIPRPAMVDGVIKYAANQEGVWRIRDEIESPFRINAEGWNSGHEDYNQRRGGRARIVLIGDSFVEARQVPYDDSIAEKLERLLGPDAYEVYRYGMSGAPLSQYLHVLRREAGDYSPDLVVVLLIHNDFTESYQFKQGVYASSFLKLAVEDGAVVAEIPPKRYERHWYSGIRESSATWRYLRYRQGLNFHWLRNLILGRKAGEAVELSKSRGLTSSQLTPRQVSDRAVTEYVLSELKAETERIGAELLLLMEAPSQRVYGDSEDGPRQAWLNDMVAEVAAAAGVHFVDLGTAFAEDYTQHGERFQFQHDAHWNNRAHALAAAVVADRVTELLAKE